MEKNCNKESIILYWSFR